MVRQHTCNVPDENLLGIRFPPSAQIFLFVKPQIKLYICETMTNYENYLDKIWGDQYDIENFIDWCYLKLIKNEMINKSKHKNTFDLRELTELEFDEQIKNNIQFASKWKII